MSQPQIASQPNISPKEVEDDFLLSTVWNGKAAGKQVEMLRNTEQEQR